MNASATKTIDTLGAALAEAAMRTLVRLCPEARNATTATLDAACVAMRRRNNAWQF